MSTTDPLPEPMPQEPDPVPLEALTIVPAEPALPLESWSIRPPRPPHPNFWWSLLWIFLFVLVTQGAGVVVIVVLLVVQVVLGPNREAFLALMKTADFQKSREFAFLMAPGLLVTELVSIVLGWLTLRLVVGKDWPRKVALRRPGLVHLGLTLLIFPAVVLVGDGMGELAKRLVPSLIDLEDTIGTLGQHWPWWLGVLIIGFGPGIGEELWCRAFLGRGLVGHYGVTAGIVLTSLLFGVMHVEPRQVIYAPVIGAVLHFVYWTTRSLWMPMLLHFLNNSLSFLQTSTNGPSLAFLEPLEQAVKVHPLFVYGGAVVLLLTVCAALYDSRARLAGVEGGSAPWQPAFPGVEWPPPGSSTVVVHPLPGRWSVLLVVLGVLAFVGTCAAAFTLS